MYMEPRKSNRVRNLAVTIVISICVAIIGTFSYYDYIEKKNKPSSDDSTIGEEPSEDNPALRAEWIMNVVKSREPELRASVIAQLPPGAAAEITDSRFYITDTANATLAYAGKGIIGMHTTTPEPFNFLYALQVNGREVNIILKSVQ